jgi:mRNA interferase MazF
MRRGDVVIVSLPGDYGKPRPAVILQNDRLDHQLDSYIIALLTTSTAGGPLLRIVVEPSEQNGLRKVSRMVDKLYAIPSHRISQQVGRMDDATMRNVERPLMILLDIDPLRPRVDRQG